MNCLNNFIGNPKEKLIHFKDEIRKSVDLFVFFPTTTSTSVKLSVTGFQCKVTPILTKIACG